MSLFPPHPEPSDGGRLLKVAGAPIGYTMFGPIVVAYSLSHWDDAEDEDDEEDLRLAMLEHLPLFLRWWTRNGSRLRCDAVGSDGSTRVVVIEMLGVNEQEFMI